MHEPGGPGQTFTLLPPEPDRRTPRVIALAVAGGLIVVLGVYTMLVFALGDKVPRGTTVAGVRVGGLSLSATEQRLRDQLLPRSEEPLRLTAGGKSYTVKPADAGLALDVSGTADKVYVGRTFNPVKVFGALFGGGETAPVLAVDSHRLGQSVTRLAAKVDDKATEGRITFDGGSPKATQPALGHKLDRTKAPVLIQEGYLRSSDPIALPTDEVEPQVSKAEIARAMREFATPAMSGPVKVQVGDGSFDATAAEVGSALSLVADDSGKLTPRLDGKVLAKAVAPKLNTVQVKPKDATISIVSDQPHITPGSAGHTVPPDKLGAAVLGALTKNGAARVAKVETVVTDPKLTTKGAQALGIKEVVGEFTTHYPHAAYRNTNIGHAAAKINGTLIKPDETFSLNGIVGERTEANGFTTGYVIKDGRLREELGGGVSQLATTTYNAAFFAGMRDVEHRPHGFYIDRYPVGREATVYWGSLDLKWQDNTPYGVYVQAWINPSSPGGYGDLTVRLWSTKYWTVKSQTSDRYDVKPPKTIYDEKPKCVDQEVGVSGFSVDVRRWLYRGGQQISAEKDHVVYKPEDKIVCGPPPTKKPPMVDNSGGG